LIKKVLLPEDGGQLPERTGEEKVSSYVSCMCTRSFYDENNTIFQGKCNIKNV
jgi:hypothetical protein